jgi:hypothetical protein
MLDVPDESGMMKPSSADPDECEAKSLTLLFLRGTKLPIYQRESAENGNGRTDSRPSSGFVQASRQGLLRPGGRDGTAMGIRCA